MAELRESSDWKEDFDLVAMGPPLSHKSCVDCHTGLPGDRGMLNMARMPFMTAIKVSEGSMPPKKAPIDSDERDKFHENLLRDYTKYEFWPWLFAPYEREIDIPSSPENLTEH